jgi:hypothetical protein
MVKDVYPNEQEQMMMFSKFVNFEKMKELAEIQNKINDKLGITYEFGLDKMFVPSVGLNICCIFSELQPRSDQMKSVYTFVGCCIADQVRSIQNITNENLKNVLDLFIQIMNR